MIGVPAFVLRDLDRKAGAPHRPHQEIDAQAARAARSAPGCRSGPGAPSPRRPRQPVERAQHLAGIGHRALAADDGDRPAPHRTGQAGLAADEDRRPAARRAPPRDAGARYRPRRRTPRRRSARATSIERPAVRHARRIAMRPAIASLRARSGSRAPRQHHARGRASTSARPSASQCSSGHSLSALRSRVEQHGVRRVRRLAPASRRAIEPEVECACRRVAERAVRSARGCAQSRGSRHSHLVPHIVEQRGQRLADARHVVAVPDAVRGLAINAVRSRPCVSMTVS